MDHIKPLENRKFYPSISPLYRELKIKAAIIKDVWTLPYPIFWALALQDARLPGPTRPPGENKCCPPQLVHVSNKMATVTIFETGFHKMTLLLGMDQSNQQIRRPCTAISKMFCEMVTSSLRKGQHRILEGFRKSNSNYPIHCETTIFTAKLPYSLRNYTIHCENSELCEQ
ncbi:hypothetical protein LXL04_031981 [Taraxacum kok-saghyz]